MKMVSSWTYETPSAMRSQSRDDNQKTRGIGGLSSEVIEALI